jgi:hypothetical protein
MIFKGAAGGKVEKEASTAAEEKGAAAVTTDSGWMNGDTLLTYVRRHMKNLQRTLVVWDLFAAHRDERVLSFLRSSGIDVIFIPGGCTGICQVMDVVVNRPFKNAIRASLTSWRAEQIRAKATWAAPKRSDVIGWVMDAWDNLPLATLHHGVQKHIIDPAVAPDAPVLTNLAQPALPDAPGNANDLVSLLENLSIGREQTSDGSGRIDEVIEVKGSEGSSSEAQTPAEEGDDMPLLCLKCERPLRTSTAQKCPKCGMTVHRGCMSVSSNGSCSFCP